MLFFFWISATKEPVHPYNFVSGLHSPFWTVTPCSPSAPTSHPFVSIRDSTSTRATAQIFYLIWQETLKTTTSSEGGLMYFADSQTRLTDFQTELETAFTKALSISFRTRNTIIELQ